MTGAFRGEGKTDAKDARVIAETARMRQAQPVAGVLGTRTPDIAQELVRGHRWDLML